MIGRIRRMLPHAGSEHGPGPASPGSHVTTPGAAFSEPRQLRDVTIGFMCHFHIPEKEFDRWSRQHGNAAGALPEIGMFQSVENFFLRKMLFVGEAREADRRNTPARLKLATPFHLELELIHDQPSSRFDLQLEVLVAYYRPYEALIVLLYQRIPTISVDQLIFLRDVKWYRQLERNRWSLSSNGASCESLRVAIRTMLRGQSLACSDAKTETDSPTFTLMQFENIGPAKEVASFPTHDDTLTAEEHWGLFSGDEGYRQVDVTPSNRYTAHLFDSCQQFSGRRHFLYQFSPTSCMAFLSPTMVGEKLRWAEWYRTHVADVPELDAFLRLDARVPCIADGIPIVIELCLIRYIELQRVERALRVDLGRKIGFVRGLARRLDKLFVRPIVGSSIDDGKTRLQQLDLHQDSSLWIVGGSYTDCLFSYAALRERVDRLASTQSSLESGRSSATVAFLSFLVSVISLIVAYLAFAQQIGSAVPSSQAAAAPSAKPSPAPPPPPPSRKPPPAPPRQPASAPAR